MDQLDEVSLMKAVAMIVAAVLVAGCGGGEGGGNESPAPPVSVATAFVAAGVVLPSAAETASKFRLVQTQADLDQITSRLPAASLPPSLTTPNFTLVNLIYLEGPPDLDNSSYVAIASASRASTGVTTFDWEYCGLGSVTNSPRRVFSFYTVTPSTTTASPNLTTRKLPNCIGRTVLGTTTVVSGSATMPVVNEDFQVVTTQAQWDALKVRFPGVAIPPAFVSPDFTQTNLIYVQKGDDSAQSSVRVPNVFKIPTPPINSVVVEYCAGPGVSIPNHWPFSVTAVPALSGDVRVESTFANLPNCTPRAKVPKTLVAAGDGVISAPPLGTNFLVVTTLAQWEQVKLRIPPTAIPPQFQTPDFSQNNLIYVQALDDNPASSIRVVEVLRSTVPPPVNFISVEYCGGPGTTIPNHMTFAVYAVPVLTGENRVENGRVEPPNCVAP